jgi:hypothetical protein
MSGYLLVVQLLACFWRIWVSTFWCSSWLLIQTTREITLPRLLSCFCSYCWTWSVFHMLKSVTPSDCLCSYGHQNGKPHNPETHSLKNFVSFNGPSYLFERCWPQTKLTYFLDFCRRRNCSGKGSTLCVSPLIPSNSTQIATFEMPYPTDQVDSLTHSLQFPWRISNW